MAFSLPPNFETSEQVTDRNSTLIATMTRNGHAGLADRLSACTNESPCKLEICNVCGRNYRFQLLRSAHKLHLQNGVWTVATVCTPGLTANPGHLNSIDLPAAMKRMRRLIRNSDLGSMIVLGSLDVGFNVVDGSSRNWQLFLNLLINAPPSAELVNQLAAAFPPDPAFAEPYYLHSLQTYVPFLERVSRCLRRTFWRKRWISERGHGLVFDLNGPQSNGLQVAQRSELSLWLAQYPLGARTICNNISIGTRDNGTVRFRLKSSLVLPVSREERMS